MDQRVLDFLTAVGPTLLWVAFLTFLVWRLEEPIRKELLPRIGSVGIFGVSLTITQQVVRDGLEKPDARVPPGTDERIVRRIRASGDLVREASILWLDDHPIHTAVERRLLTRLGASIETVISTSEAIEGLRWSQFDIVISNMRRPAEGEPTPLITEAAKELLGDAAVIYYIVHLDPTRGTPPGAFGITNRIEGLYLMVFDALEELEGRRKAARG